MIKIAFIIPYFGKWPIWFSAFLTSCKFNKSINWFFFTDCLKPNNSPPNVYFIETTLDEVRILTNQKLNIKSELYSHRKLCDMKPAYGHIFEDYIRDYDFWGFCDIDIIWGDIRSFISEEMLEIYDIISSRKNTISGHCTLLKNNLKNKFLYTQDDIYTKVFTTPTYCWFDEETFTEIINRHVINGSINVWWKKYLVNTERGIDSHQEYHIDKWFFYEGKLYDLGIFSNKMNEHMYLHFINWKKTIKKCEISNNNINYFYISYNKISSNPSSKTIKIINHICNYIYGYQIKLQLHKTNKKINRILKKIENIFVSSKNLIIKTPTFIKYNLSNKKGLIYIGCTKMHNLGDDALLMAIKTLFQDYFSFYIVPYKDPYQGFSLIKKILKPPYIVMLGGGTIIKKKSNQSYLKILNIYSNEFKMAKKIVFGSGVADTNLAEKVGFPTDKKSWVNFLNTCEIISVRGPFSKASLESWGVQKNINISIDPVIYFARKEFSPKKKNKTIGINIADIVGRIYGQNETALIKFANQVFEYLIANNWKIHFFSSVDTDIDYMLHTVFKDKDLSSIQIFKNHGDLTKMLDFLESMDIVIAQRLHSIIFSSLVYTPFIGLEYELKMTDYLDSIGIFNHHIRTDALQYQKTIELINNIYDNIDNEQKNIFAHISKAKYILIGERDRVIKLLKP